MANVTFALHQMGWADFQSLCISIIRETLGQTVGNYLDRNDGGRDGAFTGSWEQEGGESFTGEFVIQVKHTTRPDGTLGPADFTDEFNKAERLASMGRCDVYLLMTNARITARTEEMLHSALRSRGIHQSRILGATWINKIIIENPRLRMLVPRLYGLGDLTQILDERAYSQARAVLDSMRTDLAKLVRTTTYEKAAKALDNHGFVLLVGAPATGKTTIAAQLALASADAFDTYVVTLDDAVQFSDRWNPNERQLFWLDDAFGATQLSPYLASSWQRITPKVKAAIEGGSKFVLTTRNYILSNAWQHLKPGSFPLAESAQVIVDVADLEARERRQILYNHLKHGEQPKAFIQALVPYLDEASDHPGFAPELARRIADPAFTTHLKPPTAANVTAFFEKPQQFLADTLAGLDNQSFSALGLIFNCRGWLPSPIIFTDSLTETLTRLGGTIEGVTRALEHMEGSLVTNIIRDGQSGWIFAHPTMIDAYAERIRSPELLHLFIEGVDINVLLDQTTSGVTGLTNAIVLPEALWPTVIKRLDEKIQDSNQTWRQRHRCRSYIATQCALDFQLLYLDHHPELLDQLSTPGSSLEYDPNNKLITNLHQNGVLPEHARAVFVRHLIDYCIAGIDWAVLWATRFRDMLTSEEEMTLRMRLRTEVVPDLESILQGFIDDIPWDEYPGDFTEEIESFSNALIDEFKGDETVRSAAEDMIEAWWDWILDQPPPEDPPDDTRRYHTPAATTPQTQGQRSVFDDLVGEPPETGLFL
ncbi:MAG: hypothetical protein KTV45_15495 [Acidimicrobiia bacterium]|nr:hypothetical protein [Acidimicrobiia bacterium]